MKRKSLLSILTLLLILTVSSCKEDEYMDWKIINDNWLAKNKTAVGVETTASGLQYKVIYQGTERHPNKTSYVTVSYVGKLVDGTVFDSATEVEMRLSNTVKGFIEGVSKMNGGGNYILYIPSELAYGNDGSGTIPPHSTIIFNITLVSSEY